MPVLLQLYIIFFCILILLNLYYWLKFKAKLWLFFYELLSGSFMIMMMVAYWRPTLLQDLNYGTVAAFAAVIAFDFYFTVYGSDKDLGFTVPEMTQLEMETAKAVSVLFAAPAYIVGALTCVEIIKD